MKESQEEGPVTSRECKGEDEEKIT